MTLTPNMNIFIPADGQENYGQSFAAGMTNIDLHDHSGPPNKGVPLNSAGIADGSITYQKLNANVVTPNGGLRVSAVTPNSLEVDGVLNSIFLLPGNGVICQTGPATAVNRTITGTLGQIVVTNGDGVAGNPTISLAESAASVSFSAYQSANATNVTGDGTDYRIICNTAIYNVGNNYNAATGVFTAPFTGRFRFTTTISIVTSDAAQTHGNFIIRTTSGDFTIAINNPVNLVNPSDNTGAINGSVDCTMTVGDTAEIHVIISNGALDCSVRGGFGFTWFTGTAIS